VLSDVVVTGDGGQERQRLADPADAETHGVDVSLGPLNKFQRALKKLKRLNRGFVLLRQQVKRYSSLNKQMLSVFVQLK